MKAIKDKHILALKLLKRFEGFRATAYRCPAGVLTIGYGRTYGDLTSKTTRQAEEAYLINEILRIDSLINDCVTTSLTYYEMAALISFIYNVGDNAFKMSTLRKVLNNGDKTAAADQFTAWNKAGGVVNQGLSFRRAAEKRVFLDPQFQLPW